MAEFYLARYNIINFPTKYCKFKFKNSLDFASTPQIITRNIVFYYIQTGEVRDDGANYRAIPDADQEVVTPFSESTSRPTKDVNGLDDITNIPPEAVTPFSESPSLQYANIEYITQRHIISMIINF